MLGPDDPIQKALLAITHCQSLLQSTSANLASPDRETRHQAGETMRCFGELSKMITSGKGREFPAGVDVSISSLAASLPTIATIAADNSDRTGRRQLATKVLNAMDVLAMRISAATRSPNRVA